MRRVGIRHGKVFTGLRQRDLLALEVSLDDFEGCLVDIQTEQLANIVFCYLLAMLGLSLGSRAGFGSLLLLRRAARAFSSRAPSLTAVASELVASDLCLAQEDWGALVALFGRTVLGRLVSAFLKLFQLFWGQVLAQSIGRVLKLLLLVPGPLVNLALGETGGDGKLGDLLLGPIRTLFEFLD